MLCNLLDQEVAPEIRFGPSTVILLGQPLLFHFYFIFARLQLIIDNQPDRWHKHLSGFYVV